jgi:molybdate transport system substrate-binding protein
MRRKSDEWITTFKLKGTNMRRIDRYSFAVTLLISVLVVAQEPVRGQGRGEESPEAKAAAAARYAAADIRVLAPGIIYNAGLLDLAASYTKETGKKVAVTLIGMGTIVNAVKTANPPADVIMLPFELMSTLSLEGGIVPGSYMPLGRSQMGLAVPAGANHPDISTVDKLALALRSAKLVMRSNPAGGSMVAKVIEDKVIKRPELAGVNNQVSTRGEGGQALARGEGDMALQAICEILPYKQIELVGPLPMDLAAWIDMSSAVSARAMHRENALAFIRYLLRPESNTVWKAKGLERFN